MKKTTTLLIIVMASLFGNFPKAQTLKDFPVYSYIFSDDSLKGFDENEAKQSALSQGFLGEEFKIKLYYLKREFIISKYKISRPIKYSNEGPKSKSLSQPLINEDFELSSPSMITTSNQVLGWQCYEGNNNNTFGNNSCNLLGCCPNAPSGQMEVINCPTQTGYIDPVIGGVYPIYSVFGGAINNGTISNPPTQTKGNKIFRLNNNINDYSVSKISKTFSVNPLNTIFQFAYLSVFSTGHLCCDASAFKVIITNINTNSVLTCPNFSIAAPSNQCSTVTPVPFYNPITGLPYTGTGTYVFSKWNIAALDFSSYVGQNLNIDFISTDCVYGGHYSYCYIDAAVSSPKLKIMVGDSAFAINNDTANVFICQNTNTTINAPLGFDSYTWSGPGGITGTNSALSTSVSGTYTLGLGQLGGCGTVSKIINVNYPNPNVQVNSSTPTLCLGGSATLTANNLTSWWWAPGETGSSYVITPNSAGLTTYSVIGVGAYGCLYSGFYTIFVTQCVGLNEKNLSQNEILLYPNPNNGEFVLTIEKQIENGEIKIENVLGQIIYSQAITEGKNKINIKQIPAGTYYYTITQSKEPIKKGNLKIE